MKLRLYFIAWFFLLALLLAPHMAAAQMLGTINTIGVHSVTRHDPGLGSNDLNFGVSVATDKGYLAGAYYNSHFRMSYYAGWSTPEWYRMKLVFGGVTGYFATITPIVIPSIKLYQGNGWSAWASGSPIKITPEGQAVQHLSFVWSL